VGGASRCVSLHRAWGAKAFSERERQLIDVFQRECRWLDEPLRPVRRVLLRDLSARQRETLQALARGLSEKQVAAVSGHEDPRVYGEVHR